MKHLSHRPSCTNPLHSETYIVMHPSQSQPRLCGGSEASTVVPQANPPRRGGGIPDGAWESSRQ